MRLRLVPLGRPRRPQGPLRHHGRHCQDASRRLLLHGRSLRLCLCPQRRCRLLRADRQVRRASLRRRHLPVPLRQEGLQGQVAVPAHRHRRRHPGLCQGARLRRLRPHLRMHRQPLRRLQGQREQEAHGHRGSQGPHGIGRQPVRPYHHPRNPHVDSPRPRQGGIQVPRVHRALQDQPHHFRQPPRLRTLVLRLQRARHHDPQEDRCRHPVCRQHSQARHRHRWRGHRPRRESRPHQAPRVCHRHWRRPPLLHH
mmetsp:Transcript_18263/g.52244  ORF Transcript_18263/g.52244 Transcript_18263/m.52244 type:complete len:254 (+) Transcript_18263:405-1166(+)